MWHVLPALILAGGGGAAAADSTAGATYGECAAGGDSRMLKLDISVDPTTIVPTRSQEREPGAPHVSTVRVALTNPSAKELQLTFPNPCFLGYRIETIEGGTAPQEDGGSGCIDMLGGLRLAPGAKETKEFRWTARAAQGSYTPLAPGKYRIVGTLDKRYCNRGGEVREEPPLETPPVIVEVRPAK